MPTVDLQIGQLSIELVGGETRPSQRFTFTAAGEPVAAPEGTWQLRGGTTAEVVVPLAVDGDDLLAVFDDGEITAALAGTPLWLRHDGQTKARGRWIPANPQATPRSLTTRISILSETSTVVDIVVTPEGPEGPAVPGPGLPAGGTEGQVPRRTDGPDYETEWSDAPTTSAVEAIAAAAVSALVDSAPATLDTLNELAAALGDDANFAATVTAALAGKATTAAVTAITTLLSTSGVGVVVHGSDPDVARPTGFAVVIWIGTVEPHNWTADDLWEDPS